MEKALNPMDGRVIAVLGLAFKPNTDDMRDAKSIEVVSGLLAAGAVVRVYDPVATANARRVLPIAVEYCDSPYGAATGADAVALVPEWTEFKSLNAERLRSVTRRPLVFDARDPWAPAGRPPPGCE